MLEGDGEVAIRGGYLLGSAAAREAAEREAAAREAAEREAAAREAAEREAAAREAAEREAAEREAAAREAAEREAIPLTLNNAEKAIVARIDARLAQLSTATGKAPETAN